MAAQKGNGSSNGSGSSKWQLKKVMTAQKHNGSSKNQKFPTFYCS